MEKTVSRHRKVRGTGEGPVYRSPTGREFRVIDGSAEPPPHSLQRLIFGRITQIHVRERLWLYLLFLAFAITAVYVLNG